MVTGLRRRALTHPRQILYHPTPSHVALRPGESSRDSQTGLYWKGPRVCCRSGPMVPGNTWATQGMKGLWDPAGDAQGPSGLALAVFRTTGTRGWAMSAVIKTCPSIPVLSLQPQLIAWLWSHTQRFSGSISGSILGTTHDGARMTDHLWCQGLNWG